MSKLDESTKFWLVRELHPADQDDGAVYICKTKPEKGYYQNKHFYFWHVGDPSDKIKLSAGVAFCLMLAPGAILPIRNR